MARIKDRVTARILALQQHQRELQARATREIAEAQKEMDTLTKALVFLTPESEAVLQQVIALGLLPKE